MALDWNKEITFSGLKRSSTKTKDAYPSKTYMNLAVADRKSIEMRRVVPVAIVLVVLVALFAKFGVYDFIDRMNAKNAELAQQQQVLSGIQAQLANYDEVFEEHSMYVSSRLADDGETVPTLEALRLVDSTIRPRASVSSLNYEDNTLTLTLANASLSSVSDLMNALYEQPIVANVSVPNATTAQTSGNDVLTAMIVTLHKEVDGR